MPVSARGHDRGHSGPPTVIHGHDHGLDLGRFLQQQSSWCAEPSMLRLPPRGRTRDTSSAIRQSGRRWCVVAPKTWHPRCGRAKPETDLEGFLGLSRLCPTHHDGLLVEDKSEWQCRAGRHSHSHLPEASEVRIFRGDVCLALSSLPMVDGKEEWSGSEDGYVTTSRTRTLPQKP